VKPNGPATGKQIQQPSGEILRADFPYDENGVDVSLVRWMLSLTPTERLQALQSFADLVASSTTNVQNTH
jgi:hypothetical protein